MPNLTTLIIGGNTFHSTTELDLSSFSSLESITFGERLFSRVSTFRIDGLNRLKSFKTGYRSFQTSGNGKSGYFQISNCESLESIQIGGGSFLYYSGGFELKNLPKLKSIELNTPGYYDCGFCYCSFVIRGMDMILNVSIIRSSKFTFHYNGWFCLFSFLNNNNRKYSMN